ncbi:hypothetical protein CAC42_5249 [Sphaceloma murrayae]|uniref:Large ribosomal subunit protein uL29m n=1 Tax=Sphaceloma murrayae TaxID=2082308 RepID=A0A2K1QUT6_9PEZI|nr:hypothetical protein CAC42_5249 [Sphaceloma murrayae]
MARPMALRYLLRAAQPLSQAQLLPPPFLLPSFYRPSRHFHSSPSFQKRETNKKRGLSALKRSGLRKGQTLSVKLENLPQPVLDPAERSRIDVDPEHGLYKFFRSPDRSMSQPDQIGEHGRAWTVQELRKKGWEDLHALWWTCVYERNLISTEEEERRRTAAGYGQLEAEVRDEQVKLTMQRIRHTLTERWYTWQNAREIAKTDPSIRLEPGTEKVYLNEEELAALEKASATGDQIWGENTQESLLEDPMDGEEEMLRPLADMSRLEEPQVRKEVEQSSTSTAAPEDMQKKPTVGDAEVK